MIADPWELVEDRVVPDRQTVGAERLDAVVMGQRLVVHVVDVGVLHDDPVAGFQPVDRPVDVAPRESDAAAAEPGVA